MAAHAGTIEVQRRFSITRENPKLVNKIAGEGADPYGRYKKSPTGNASQVTFIASGVEPQNAIQKSFRFWYFLAQWETFLDRILAFDSTGESCASDRVPTANCSQIPYRSAPSLAILLTVSPPRQQRQRAARATAAFLNRFGCKPTDGRCFLSANAFVSRSDRDVTRLPRGQSSEMAPPWVQLR